MSVACQIGFNEAVLHGLADPDTLSEQTRLQWFAAYTSPRHEKRVAMQMEQHGIHCFLPLYRSVRRWKDRRKQLDLPLFPGYLFVRIALMHRLRVLQLPGVVELVGTLGRPAALPESDIETLRRSLLDGLQVKPHPFLKVGRRVRVHGGPMAGVEGILLRRKDRLRVVLSIDLIARSVAMEVDEGDVSPA
jgi:transcription antitermination factor NusG